VGIETVDADVEAFWSYYPGFIDKIFRWKTLGTDKKTIQIYRE
jgi:hypothetical protein